MDTLIEILSSPAIIGLAGTIATMIYGWVKGTEQYREIQDSKYGRALEAIEVGVFTAFKAYKEPASREKRKLSLEDAVSARNEAMESAKAEAKRNGIDLDKMFTPEHLEDLVHKTYREFKDSRNLK